MPRSAMFRSLVIFACLGHVLGESDPSCWLQSRPTGTGQDSAIRSRPGTDLDLLGSKSTSTLARLNELRARMKEEEEKIKDMKAELRNLKRIACPSGGDYVTWVTLTTGSDYTMTNGDTGFFVRTWSPNDEPATCDDFAIRSGSALLVEDKSSSVSPPCNLTLYFAIFLQVIFTTGPPAQNTFSRNVSTVNVTFEGDASHLTFSVYHDPDGAGAPSAVGHTFHPGENIIDVSSFGPISGFDLNGFNLGGGSLPLGIEFLQFNGFTLCGTQATVVGDPHIKTLDGRHYTLMNQGTFSLWRYSGVSADVMMQNLFVSSTSIDVDWQVYAHYSGHQSYTKGLLLLDKSGGSVRQSLEITSKDCQWRASASEQDPSATGLQLHTANNRTRVSFVMIKQGVRKEVAKLSVSCRKGHNINVAIDMKHSADLRFVDGELRVARSGAPVSTLQTESDEFEVKTPWKDLGGSDSASLYLQEADESGGGLNLLQTCEDAQMVYAFDLCSKHLGADMQQADGPDGDFFNDCVFDVCRGGEVAAELAAELIAVRRM